MAQPWHVLLRHVAAMIAASTAPMETATQDGRPRLDQLLVGAGDRLRAHRRPARRESSGPRRKRTDASISRAAAGRWTTFRGLSTIVSGAGLGPASSHLNMAPERSRRLRRATPTAATLLQASSAERGEAVLQQHALIFRD